MTVGAQRAEADALFQRLPMPDSSDENYRFLPLEGLSLPARKDSSAAISTFTSSRSSEILWIPGEADRETPDFSATNLTDRSEAADFPDEWRNDKFAAHALSCWSDGAGVAIRAHMEKPVHVHRSLTPGAFRSVHRMTEGSSGTLVEELTGLRRGETVTGAIELHAARGSRATYVLFQNVDPGADLFLRLRLTAEAGAEVNFLPVIAGGGRAQIRLDAWCRGENASVTVKGLARGGGSQQFDLWFNAHHTEPGGRSGMEVRLVMNERSKAVFNGLIHITEKASGTEASQKCRALLLSEGAAVHASPKLLIATDQVKCGHGASVSTVNPEQIHYLQCRGILREQAEKMIVAGFMEEFLPEHPELRRRMADALEIRWEEEP